MASPCGWTVTSCGCGKCWDGFSPSVQARAQSIAAYVMWAATGRRYGACEITVMPPGMWIGTPDPDTEYRTYPVGYGWGDGLLSPVIENGLWYNRARNGKGWCCPGACEIPLDGPTTTAQIAEVTVNGDVVDPDAYQVQNGDLLVRIDGGCWPCCNNYGNPSTGFTVTYSIGLPIPAAVQGAFELLACDVAKACIGGACALPRTITRLTRQGVDLEVAEIPTDPSGLILTGIPRVDDVIRADNPGQLFAPPLVLSPDMPRPRRIT